LRGLDGDDPPLRPERPERPELTAAGLVRRSPKQQLRDLRNDEVPPEARAGANQRTPEEVRQMLSRYRTGLQRGRTSPPPTPPATGAGDEGDVGPDR
jgi:hypothetical protein